LLLLEDTPALAPEKLLYERLNRKKEKAKVKVNAPIISDLSDAVVASRFEEIADTDAMEEDDDVSKVKEEDFYPLMRILQALASVRTHSHHHTNASIDLLFLIFLVLGKSDPRLALG
jgi:hypothetical protein